MAARKAWLPSTSTGQDGFAVSHDAGGWHDTLHRAACRVCGRRVCGRGREGHLCGRVRKVACQAALQRQKLLHDVDADDDGGTRC